MGVGYFRCAYRNEFIRRPGCVALRNGTRSNFPTLGTDRRQSSGTSRRKRNNVTVTCKMYLRVISAISSEEHDVAVEIFAKRWNGRSYRCVESEEKYIGQRGLGGIVQSVLICGDELSSIRTLD